MVHDIVYPSSLTMTDDQDQLKKNTYMSFRATLGVSQEEYAVLLRNAFMQIGSDRTVTKKSISDWETGRHKPRLTPEETYMMCLVSRCSLEQLAEASRNAEKKEKNT